MTTVASNARTAFTPDELERRIANRLGQRLQGGLRRAAELAGLRGEPARFSLEARAIGPRQRHPGAALPARQAIQLEARRI